jgi:hypothetical protein
MDNLQAYIEGTNTAFYGAADQWTIKAGAIAEEKETFTDKYPHCLPGTYYDPVDIDAAIAAEKCVAFDVECADGYTCAAAYGTCYADDGNAKVSDYSTERIMSLA